MNAARLLLACGLLAAGAGDAETPVESPPEPAAKPAAQLVWRSYDEGLTLAAREDRLILVNFTADWCRFCRKMKAETYADPGVAAYLAEHFVAVMVDTQVEKKLQYRYGATSLPTIWFLKSDGERITRLPGFVPAPMFLNVLRYIATGSYERMDFEAFLAEAGQG